MSRNITFDIGFSPGDIVVFSRAVKDLCDQYPDFDVQIKTCCPAIFENNPLVNKKSTVVEPNIVPIADNLIASGYSLDDVAKRPKELFTNLIKENILTAIKKDNKWLYSKDGVDLFFCLQEDKEPVEREVYQIHYDDIHNSGWSGRHFSSAFYYELEKHLNVKIKQTSLLPALFLSDEEKGWINQVEQEFNYRGKFWIINAGWKDDYPLKAWPTEYWQELVNILKDKVQFVQVGELGDNHHHPELENVFDLRGKTDLRQLIRLSYHAEGACSHVSLLHHLMAAWQKPCITIAGGREPRRWESYPHIRYMDTNGQLGCCSYDGCWQSGRMEGDENKTCKNLVGKFPRCMAMIYPAKVSEEVMNHYYGGKLTF